jgi:hypothetical protein
MKKKIMIGSLLAVFMLVAISFISSAEVNTDVEKKESPLWKIRTRRSISEKISDIIENIKTKFLGERMFFLPKLIRTKFIQINSLYTVLENPSEIMGNCCIKTTNLNSLCFRECTELMRTCYGLPTCENK